VKKLELLGVDPHQEAGASRKEEPVLQMKKRGLQEGSERAEMTPLGCSGGGSTVLRKGVVVAAYKLSVSGKKWASYDHPAFGALIGVRVREGRGYRIRTG